MRDFIRWMIIKGNVRVMAAIIVLFIFVPVAAYSYQFEFQEVQGVKLEVMTREEFEAQFGDNPDVPRNDAAIIRLAKRLFKPYWERTSKNYIGEAKNREYELGLLFAALQNPDIFDSTRYQVDSIMSKSIPPLPKTYTSGHFKFFYTDNDPDPAHNVTLDQVMNTAKTLNAAWRLYEKNFKVPKHYMSGSKRMIDVKVYYLGTGLGETHSSWDYISLNSKETVRDRCIRKSTSAHELFHRVQYSYGYVSGTANMKWIVEGTADWSMKYSGIKDYMISMNIGLKNPDENLISKRSYDAAHFWIYLERKATWRAMRDVWATYETNGHDAKAAVNTVVNNRLGLNFDKYVWLWSVANYIKDLANARQYDYFEDETIVKQCGIIYGPLSHVRAKNFTISESTQGSKTFSVKPYGTDYYNLIIHPDLTNIEIEIDGDDAGNFAYSFVPIKNNSYININFTKKTDFTFSRTIAAGQWDRLAVVVSGGSIGGEYTISVNPCITGQWVDNYGYVWTLTQSGTLISGNVQTLGCGIWDVTGTYTGPSIILTATNPLPIEDGCCTAFTYTGTVSQCHTASGTWTNACGLSGSWFMTKSDADTIVPVFDSGGPTPCSRK